MADQLCPLAWAEAHFSESNYSDCRRRDRLVSVAAAMAAHPYASIPQMFHNWYDLKATYHLFAHSESTPETIHAHRQEVREQLHEPGEYLLLSDTTTLSYSSRKPIAGLKKIGNGNEGLQGFSLHSVLAVRWQRRSSQSCLHREPAHAGVPDGSVSARRPPVEVLGVVWQKYWVRTERSISSDAEGSRRRQERERESERWAQGVAELGQASPSARWVHVADREGDIYEYMRQCQQKGHGFVIRASQDRHVDSSNERLMALARSVDVWGELYVKLPATSKRRAREATLSYGGAHVLLRSPWRPGYGAGKQPSITATVIRVWEASAGEDALEWILLSDRRVHNAQEAVECIRQYATRWSIEEYHKVLKSGLGAERLQLSNVQRLYAAVAIMSVVALRIMSLREQLRINAQAPADASGLSAEELQLLRRITPKQLQTVEDVALAIGRLGGHMNRRGDGPPGLQSLSRGMSHFALLYEGYRLAREP